MAARERYVEVCASLLEDTIGAREASAGGGGEGPILEVPFPNVAPAAGLELLPAPDFVTGGGQAFGDQHAVAWVFRQGVLTLTDLSTSLPFPPTSLRLRLGPESAPLSRDAVGIFPSSSRRDTASLLIMTRDMQLHRLSLQHQPGASLLAVAPGPRSWERAVLPQLPTGATSPTCVAWLDDKALVIGYSNGKVQHVQVEWRGPDSAARPVAEVDGGGSGGGGGGGAAAFLGSVVGGWRRGGAPAAGKVLAVSVLVLGGEEDEPYLLALHADAKVRVWGPSWSGAPLATWSLPQAATPVHASATTTHKLAALPELQTQAGGGGVYLLVSMSSPDFSQVWLSRRVFQPSNLRDSEATVWLDPLSLLQHVRDVTLAFPPPPSPSRPDNNKSPPSAVLWLACEGGGGEGGVRWLPVTKGAESIKDAAQLRSLWRPEQVVGSASLVLPAWDPRQLAERMQQLQAAVEEGQLSWEAVLEEQDAAFARLLVQQEERQAGEEAAGGVSRSLLQRAVERWLPPGTPAPGPAPVDPEARAVWLADLVRAAVQRDFAPEPYVSSEHGPERLRRVVGQWGTLLGLVQRGLSDETAPLALLTPSNPPQASTTGGGSGWSKGHVAALIVRADRVGALLPAALPTEEGGPAAPLARVVEGKSKPQGPSDVQAVLAELDQLEAWLAGSAPGLVYGLAEEVARAVLYEGGGAPPDLTRLQPFILTRTRTVAQLPPPPQVSLSQVQAFLLHLLRLNTHAPPPPMQGAEAPSPLLASLSCRSLSPLLNGYLLPRVLQLVVYLVLLQEDDVLAALDSPADAQRLQVCLSASVSLLHSFWLLAHLCNRQLALASPTASTPDQPSWPSSSSPSTSSYYYVPLLAAFVLDRPPPTAHWPGLLPSTGDAFSAGLSLLSGLLLRHPLSLLPFLERLQQQGDSEDGGQQQQAVASPAHCQQELFVLVQAALAGQLAPLDDRLSPRPFTPRQTRLLQRALARCLVSEAQRVGSSGGGDEEATVLFDRAEQVLLQHDLCLLDLDDSYDHQHQHHDDDFAEQPEEEEDGGGRAMEVDDEEEEDAGFEERKGSPSTRGRGRRRQREAEAEGRGGVARVQRRAQHFLNAVSLLDPCLGLPGCPPRRLLRLAIAGLRALPHTAGEEGVSERLLSLADGLWAAVFQAAMEEDRFDEALCAIRAEHELWQDDATASSTQDQDQQQQTGGGGARGGMQQARSTKLSYLVVELCERGRLDKVCSLPWAKTDGNDEVDIVEGVLRNYARFSNVETDDTQRPHDDTDRMDEDGSSKASPPVDYYHALFAFLVRLRNYRGAAVELYRLCKRLDGGTAFEDDPTRLHKKTDALAQVCNCLELLPSDQQLLLWATDETADESSGAGQQQQPQHGSKRRVKVVPIADVRHELTYALAAREYLRVAGPEAQALRPLNLTPAVTGAKAGQQQAVSKQVEALSALLCSVGLYERAASLLEGFGLPLQHVISSLATAVVDLSLGQSAAFVPPEDALPQPLPTFAKHLQQQDEEQPLVLPPAKQAELLLRDLLQRAAKGSLYVQAARLMVLRSSYFMPDWLLHAFTQQQPAAAAAAAGGVGDAGPFLQVHTEKAWFLLRSPTPAQPSPAAAITPSGRHHGAATPRGGGGGAGGSLVAAGTSAHVEEAAHLLSRALSAATALVQTALTALVPTEDDDSSRRRREAYGAVAAGQPRHPRVWVPLGQMDVLLQVASQVSSVGGPVGGGLSQRCLELEQSLAAYYRSVAAAEAAAGEGV